MSASLQTISDFSPVTLLDQLSNADPTSADLRARAAFWRRYIETTPGLTDDQIGRLHLSCFKLDALADRMDAPAAVVALVPAPAPRKVTARATPAKPAKAPKMTAEQFWALHSQALDSVQNLYGDRWQILAPRLDTVCLTVPTRLCSMIGPLGGKIKWRADWRMPAAKFWPGGTLPDCGLIVAPAVPPDRGPLPGAGVAAIVAYQILADKQHRERAMACDPSYPSMGGG